jgi:hypothetical protein
MTDDFKKLDDAKKRLEWHVEVSNAVRRAIEPLAGDRAPPGESIEVVVSVKTKGSEMWASYFLDADGVFITNWADEPE